jgi:hypothetical protein
MTTIAEYNSALESEPASIAAALEAAIGTLLPAAEGRLWHGHPVWFIGTNPIVGYSLKKAGVELLFWSGQSFASPGLHAVGKFQAAGANFKSVADIDHDSVAAWLSDAERIQWDYANLPKLRKLEKLTDF